MRIYKRGNIYWTEFIVDNRRYQMSTRTKDKKLAEEIAAALQADVVRNKFNIPAKYNKNYLFKEVFEQYLKNQNVSKKTIEIRIVAAKHFLPVFQNFDIKNISVESLEKYQLQRKLEVISSEKNIGKREQDISFRLVNIEIATLYNFFNYCIKYGYLGKNPAAGIKKLNELSRLKTLSDSDTGNERRDYLIKQENVTRLAQLNLDENITSLIQSDEYARRLAKAVKLKEGDDWFINYVEHFKKHTPLKEVEDLSEYFVS